MSLIDDAPELWERQPKESDPAWVAFMTYRDMQPKRSLAKVALALGKSKQLMEGWSSRHEWRRRAAAWDNEQDRVARQAELDAIRQMHRRHANLAVAMLNKAAARILGDEAIGLKPLDPAKVGIADLIKLVEAGTKIERIARGEPDKIEIDLGVSQEAKTAVDQLLEVLDRMGENLTSPTFSPIPGAGSGEPTGPVLGPDQEDHDV